MMFDNIYQQTRKFEGGYANNKADRGGATIFGISSKYWPDDFATVKALVDQGKSAEAETYTRDFYEKNFWKPSGAEQAPAEMQPLIFDAAVNHGVGTAKKMLASSNGDPSKFLDQRQNYMNQIVQNDPSQEVFQKGWENRVNQQRQPNMGQGNIDLNARPVVNNADGTFSTVRSMSFNMDGKEILVPTISDDGRTLTEEQAIQQYKKTGKNLGVFNTPAEATAYAEQLHNQQAQQYGRGAPMGKKPVTDPAILAQLNAPARQPVTDPKILAQLNNKGQNEGFWGGIKQDLGARAEKYGNILNSNEPALGKAYLAAGQSAGLANDLTGRAMSAVTPDFIGEPLQKAGQYVLDRAGSLPSFGGGTIGERIPQELAQLEKDNPRLAEYAKATGNLGLLYTSAKIGSSKPVVDTASATAQAGKSAGKGILNVVDDATNGVVQKIDDAKGLLVPEITDSQKAVITLAKKHAIPVELDDVSDSTFYKTMISEGRSLPFSGAAKQGEKVQKSINSAVAKTFGQNADNITPEVIASAYDDLGKQFQSFTKGKTFEIKPSFYSKLDEITNKASRGLYGKDGKDFLPEYIKDIQNLADENGIIKGERLDKVRRQFAEIARSRNDDIGLMADDLESAVVDIIGQGDKAIKASLKDVKYKYKNLKTVQRIALKDQVDGNIRPDLLTSAVKTKFGEDAFAKGKAGDLGEIARVGQMIKDKIPNSGTSQRTMARSLLTGNIGATLPVALLTGGASVIPQLATSGIAMGANRLLQSRNSSLLDDVLKKNMQKGLLNTP